VVKLVVWTATGVRPIPIPVLGIGRYSPVLVGIGFGTDTSSPVIRLPVSTVNAVAMHAYSFMIIPYFRAYMPHIYVNCTHLYPTQNRIFSTKFCTARYRYRYRCSCCQWYRAPARYQSNPNGHCYYTFS